MGQKLLTHGWDLPTAPALAAARRTEFGNHLRRCTPTSLELAQRTSSGAFFRRWSSTRPKTTFKPLEVYADESGFLKTSPIRWRGKLVFRGENLTGGRG
jgi:hypothetical protein